MSTLRLVLWGFLAVLGAVALAYVTGLVNPHEKVNGLWLVVAAECIYVLAFRFYGRWISRRVVELNDQRVTPAIRLNDGVNFHPTNRYVLFGHHFAAIAGAGPLVPLAVDGHLLLIPRYGPMGAAAVPALVAWTGALVAVLAVNQLWQVLPPLGTLVQSILVSMLGFAMAAIWPTPGFFVDLKLLVIAVLSLMTFLMLGEFDKAEIATVRCLLTWRTTPVEHPHKI